MDGRAVDQAVRELIRPALKDVGFHRFSGRSAWRQHSQTVDLVVFRSFTSYVASCGLHDVLVRRHRWHPCWLDTHRDSG